MSAPWRPADPRPPELTKGASSNRPPYGAFGRRCAPARDRAATVENQRTLRTYLCKTRSRRTRTVAQGSRGACSAGSNVARFAARERRLLSKLDRERGKPRARQDDRSDSANADRCSQRLGGGYREGAE